MNQRGLSKDEMFVGFCGELDFEMGKFRKLFGVFKNPRYWPALARGIVPGVEHNVAFRDRLFASVIDVGANKGQFAVFAKHRWPKARLMCFEPLEGPRACLAAVTKGTADIYALALGDVAREATIHVASRVDSSSLLPIGEAQKSQFNMTETGQVTVPVRRLDEVLSGIFLPRPALLKIDVQGFEYETLKGAEGLISQIDSVYVECSFVELYTGQKLAADVVELLRKHGFVETERFNIHRDNDQELQADFLFERPKT